MTFLCKISLKCLNVYGEIPPTAAFAHVITLSMLRALQTKRNFRITV